MNHCMCCIHAISVFTPDFRVGCYFDVFGLIIPILVAVWYI
jgi:hypothetical protein